MKVIIESTRTNLVQPTNGTPCTNPAGYYACEMSYMCGSIFSNPCSPVVNPYNIPSQEK
ncbi:hypothetical protein [Alkaliphilus transvaalensis]|uniref:hypothetical protein n=1 Tax=Alkaliphilus transvaalensis TaxID=114628 RepID=UPI0012EBD714|nr:hypothetical protein [Alkaliphilus transvaalensis]